VILAQAAFVAVQFGMNYGSLKQSAEVFAAPNDSFWFYWGSIGLNAVIVIATVILGIYFFRAKQLELKYVLPLSLVAALFGGYGIAVGVAVMGICVYLRYRPNAI